MDSRAALGVVMAAAGYPEGVRRGDVISGLDAAARLPGKVFPRRDPAQRGCDCGDHQWWPRVVRRGLGETVSAAQRQAYALADTIRWPGVQYRRTSLSCRGPEERAV